MPSMSARSQALIGIIPAALRDLKRRYESDSEEATDEADQPSLGANADGSCTIGTMGDSNEWDEDFSNSSDSTAANVSSCSDSELARELLPSSDSETSADSDTTDGDHDLGSVFNAMTMLMGRQYLAARITVRKQRTQLDLILGHYKQSFPKEFRLWVQMDPDAFDALVSILRPHVVFQNESYYEQKSVEEQLAIALHRFGVYGCGASVRLIAQHFGVSPGLVDLASKRVIAAVLGTKELMETVTWPSDSNRAKLKAHVLSKCGSAEAAQGWLMLDGTHVNLYQKPNLFGDRFFNRKANYSFNVQITGLPLGEIIDYAVGDVGSANDLTGLRRTKLYKDQAKGGAHILLNDGEFCWGDSGYPLHTWLILPFPLSSAMTIQQSNFNTKLAKIRVAAEHTIGFLKGRFQSLKESRILILRPSDVQYATLWMWACIHLHMFAYQREQDPDILTDEWAHDGVRWEQAQNRARRIQDQKAPKRGRYDFTGTGSDRTLSKGERDIQLSLAKDFRQQLVLSMGRSAPQTL